MEILIIGAGNIGTAIAHLLQNHADYKVVLADRIFSHALDKKIKTETCDVNDDAAFTALLKSHSFSAVISSLPYHANVMIAKKAREYNLHYFDLTEDVKTTAAILEISKGAKTVFIPQCGLAPGFINIAAHHLMQGYDEIDSVLLRVGALPQFPNNALQYALTWSTDGLINEYGNPCEAIVDGQYTIVEPLDHLENIIIDGVAYEAFNTSGGLSTMWKSCIGKVKNLNYKTLRYPGHCEKIKFLMNDLKLNKHRDILKTIFEDAIPKTQQDVVVVYVSLIGKKNNKISEVSYAKQLYPAKLDKKLFTAIQLSTASGICAVADLVLTKQYDLHGFVTQEQFAFQDVIDNRFGHYYA
ncbi:MAG TPA: saccharopine dehydrogenase C-terminal domain-containing protein [Coxiellaceae bacterium]|nr:MAG: saccharopine dehydrogenase [Gammaproteobacteria bacterium RIFCSPHIGHO2_12_FULL_36_30]HLB56386.1 saccharopine dehydrogenase C-terminal domain-containing protein [Coxiellaceae bacterium]